MTCPTTRRYPRTLAEAWPREHMDSLEFFPRPAATLGRVLACIAGAVVVGLLVGRAFA